MVRRHAFNTLPRKHAAAETASLVAILSDTPGQGVASARTHLLSLVKKTAVVVAHRHSGEALLEVIPARLEFPNPVKSGDMVEVVAVLSERCPWTMTVDVEAISEAYMSGERRTVLNGQLVVRMIDAPSLAQPSSNDASAACDLC